MGNASVIKLDPEFKELLPLLATEEHEGLEQSLLAEGCRDPLVLWQGILIDGHNRYALCQKHGIEFRVAKRSFDSREDVKVWIIKNHLSRRNISLYQRIKLACKLEDIFRAKAKEQQRLSRGPGIKGWENSPNLSSPIHTRDEIAKIAGVSSNTVSRVQNLEEKATQEQKERLSSGEASINEVYMQIRYEEQQYTDKEEPIPFPEWPFVVKDTSYSSISVKEFKRLKYPEDFISEIAQEDALVTLKTFPDDFVNKTIQGDTLEVLKILPNESIDCVVTSPPYYGLRDYGVEAGIGLEESFEEYLDKILQITAELKRILKAEGTMWWNHGDSYGGTGSKGDYRDPKYKNGRNGQEVSVTQGWMQKCLLMQPYRLAQRMIDEQGWILRNIIIWHKPNCMPAPAEDRFTVDYEPILFFSKSKRYWFEQQFEKYSDIRKPITKEERIVKGNWQGSNRGIEMRGGAKNLGNLGNYETGRTKRSVWKIPTQPYPEAHFAVFPEELCLTPIKAGCPPKGIVLDPFAGSGTTGKVATGLGRNFIGIELNPEYIKLAQRRLRQEIFLAT